MAVLTFGFVIFTLFFVGIPVIPGQVSKKGIFFKKNV